MKTKTILFLLTFLTICTFTYSQSFEHLVFKGVPIDGTLDEYVSKMKQEGFTNMRTENETAFLNGDFAGYKNCRVVVSTLKQKNLVSKIRVIFSNKETWSTLSGNYFELKDMLTEKYGDPSDVTEKFDDSSYSQKLDDYSKMNKVKFDSCKYLTVWKTDNGDIQLSIDQESMIRCYVVLVYFDRVNGNIIKTKAIRDL